jgi:hypothetical protein
VCMHNVCNKKMHEGAMKSSKSISTSVSCDMQLHDNDSIDKGMLLHHYRRIQLEYNNCMPYASKHHTRTDVTVCKHRVCNKTHGLRVGYRCMGSHEEEELRDVGLRALHQTKKRHVKSSKTTTWMQDNRLRI